MNKDDVLDNVRRAELDALENRVRRLESIILAPANPALASRWHENRASQQREKDTHSKQTTRKTENVEQKFEDWKEGNTQ